MQLKHSIQLPDCGGFVEVMIDFQDKDAPISINTPEIFTTGSWLSMKDINTFLRFVNRMKKMYSIYRCHTAFAED